MRRVFFLAAVILVWVLLLSPVVAHATAMMAIYDSDSGSCTAPSTGPEYRTYDGTCNNMGQGTWGSAGSQLIRLGEASYSDGISAPRLSVVVDDDRSLPSTRAISNAVVAQSDSIPNASGASGMLMQWGQFLDHDIDLTPVHTAESHPDTYLDESMPIPVDADDSRFGLVYGDSGMPFTRSEYAPGTGILKMDGGEKVPREQINAITAYIDASQIYGSDPDTARLLRDPAGGGKLLMTGDMLLQMVDNEFVSGDERAREQVGLTAMHTLFSREHNRLAAEIEDKLRQATRIEGIPRDSTDPVEKQKYEEALDEKVYQEARKLIGAMMQSITFNEFLPTLLGGGAPSAYGGYKDTVNPGIANEFSTAAYRFGHSTLSDTLMRLDEDGQSLGDLALAEAFFNPEHLLDAQYGGIEAVLRGLASQRGQEVDPFLVDGVRNLLFGPPVDMGFDLAALNMQRGRDHGLPGYTEMRRVMFGDDDDFIDIHDWGDLDGIMMAGAADLLYDIYEDVDDIDLWIGGLAEAHVNGGMLGELFSAIISGQFERLRAGDRFWYQNDGMFEEEWMMFIEGSTLSAIMARNGISGLQANVFSVPAPGILALLTVGFLGLQFRIRSGSGFQS